MAHQFPVDIREAALNELALLMDLAVALHEKWRDESEPTDLLNGARAVRDAADNFARTIERLWPNQPPPDYGKVL